MATVENARRAADMGVDLIVLTGNPGNGVSNELIVASLKEISAAVGDRVMLAAGKMHASGVAGEGGEKIMTPADAEAFMQRARISFCCLHRALYRASHRTMPPPD